MDVLGHDQACSDPDGVAVATATAEQRIIACTSAKRAENMTGGTRHL